MLLLFCYRATLAKENAMKALVAMLGVAAVSAPPLTVEMLSDRLDRHEVELQSMRVQIERLQERLAVLPNDFDRPMGAVDETDIPKHDGVNFYFRVDEIIPVSQDVTLEVIAGKRKEVEELRKRKDKIEGDGPTQYRERSRLLGEIARLEIEIERLEQGSKTPRFQLFGRDAEGRFIRCDLDGNASRAAATLLVGDVVKVRGMRRVATASEIAVDAMAVSKVRKN